jgi:hypothetical protein
LEDEAADIRYNEESVRFRELGAEEQLWLRRVLRIHLRLTESVAAATLLRKLDRLRLLCVQPVQPPCSAAETWVGIIKRLEEHDLPALDIPQIIPSEGPLAV